MSLDSSPPKQRSFDGSVFSESSSNLPTRHSSSNTQIQIVENTLGGGRRVPARYPLYGSQNKCDRSLSSQGLVSRSARIRTFWGGTDDVLASSKAPGSLRLSLDGRSLGESSPSFDSLGDLSRDSSQSAPPHLLPCPAYSSASPECLDDARSGTSEGDYIPAVSGGPFDTGDSTLDPSSEDGSYLPTRLTRSLWGQPSSVIHASDTTHIAAPNSSSPPARLSSVRATLSPITPSRATPECSLSATYEPRDGNVREESLYDALHGQLFEGADPWRALDGVLGLQPQQQFCVDGQTNSYDAYQEDVEALDPGHDQELAFLALNQLERVPYAEMDEIDEGRSTYLVEAFAADVAVSAGTEDPVEERLDHFPAEPLSMGWQSTAVEELTTHGEGLLAVNESESSRYEEAVYGESTGIPRLDGRHDDDYLICRISGPRFD